MMFTPAAFRWDDELAALEFVSRFNFGTLLTVDGATPHVTHLPFLVDPSRRVLRAHLASSNPQALSLGNCDCIAAFLGPHAYVSPDWYGERGDDVPTWNYVAVHVAGRARILAEVAAVEAMLSDLAAHEEARRFDLASGGRVWTMDRMESSVLARMRRGIVAFEVDIANIDAKRKLSQNKPQEVAARVADKLAAAGAIDLAAEMTRARQ